MAGQKCINIGAVYQSLSVVNTVSEFFIALFPVIGAYTLRVDARQRWHVISLLSLGFLVTIAGCFRTFFVWKCVAPDNWDGGWWTSAQWLCAEVEINLAMVRKPAVCNARLIRLDLCLRGTPASACGAICLPVKQLVANLDYADSSHRILQVSTSRIDMCAGKH